ncbi:glycosyltransferase [Bifidobacterium sp. ESL0745]|uniref:glycosyltransferase n=1 Tax=Bifidobacterium sp. ESL0745 TaxID=2983226 RepID=UPI0023F82D19|nr:glycosyltransferase [Bifidobacterium sp. ESL0745]MDF7666163.1 glycosyltransferase [Bifidobacterium sp. ESL0745]
MQQNPNSSEDWETVNRIVYPITDQDVTLPLYAIEWTRPHITDTVIDPRLKMQSLPFGQMNKDSFEHLIDESVHRHSDESGKDPFKVDNRDQITVSPKGHISLCTFFNAFPASYWKRWTNVSQVRLSAKVQGKGTITVFKSTGRGLFSPVSTISVDTTSGDEGSQEIETIIPMTGLIDGGYFWFDAEASEVQELTIADAGWAVPAKERVAKPNSTLSIAITTYNRPIYCLNQLKTIAKDQRLRNRLDTIYCIDQGDQLVREQAEFPAVSSQLGPQLTYLRQNNMGGSAGFSRGMYETIKAGKSAYTLLLDDDAITEPESLLRALQFADYAAKPTIVGGGMLHLDNRTVLYTQGERWDYTRMWMKPSQGLKYNHDFARFPLRDSPERHQRVDIDFNGWWMCLIPVKIMKEIGLSLPFFIKFDDAEYALRAREHGYPTVSLPGVAVWHQAWHDKDPARTWEEYFSQRNRWILGLLHCPKPNSRFAYEILYGDAELGMKFIYSALKLRQMGLNDILKGPQYIVESMPNKIAEVRAARKGFNDTALSTSAADFPEPKREFVGFSRTVDRRQDRKAGAKALLHALTTKDNGLKDKRPDIAVPSDQNIWESFVGVNSALVTSPDGNSLAWCRRDSKLFRKQMKRGVRLVRTLMKNWEKLSQRYRAYDMASLKVWSKVFAENSINEE